jgi:hemerythrin superfamily protein
MANVFEVLGADHEEVRSLLTELAHGDGEGQEKLVERLVIEESKHEAVEEMYFWPTVRESVPGGDDLADTAIKQETEGKAVLDRLDKAGADSAELGHLVSLFTAAALEHIAFEEREVWPKLRDALDAEAQSELGEKLSAAKGSAPTRPHPGTPPSPGVLKTAGAAVATADKVRDKLTGRGD